MKTVHTELSHITDLINRYALACPHIRFELIHNGKNIFSSTGSGNMLQVIAAIYGTNVAQNMVKLETETNDFQVIGYIAKPEITRSSRNYITIIINGRYIKSHPLVHAILRAYDTLLPIHRSPIVVLSIEMDPILVDVNVHPTKLEVRFSKEKQLIELIETSIIGRLKKTNLIPTMKSGHNVQRKETTQQEIEFSHATEYEKYGKLSNTNQTTKNNMFGENSNHINEQPIINFEQHHETIVPAHFNDNQAVDDTNKQDEEQERLPKLYPIGQLQGTYILAQNENGFYMVDQHAAQERIKYEFFKQKLAQPDNELQTLLMPLTFEFTKDEQLFIEKQQSSV